MSALATFHNNFLICFSLYFDPRSCYVVLITYPSQQSLISSLLSLSSRLVSTFNSNDSGNGT
jgi:hypothetical protein